MLPKKKERRRTIGPGRKWPRNLSGYQDLTSRPKRGRVSEVPLTL